MGDQGIVGIGVGIPITMEPVVILLDHMVTPATYNGKHLSPLLEISSTCV